MALSCLPKAFPRRAGTTDSGKEYEFKIMGLLALRCATMKQTKDLWIGSNVNDVGDFDDVVLCQETSAGKHIVYLLQLKHQDDPKNIKLNDFSHSTKDTGKKRKKSKESFSLVKYSKGFAQLKSEIDTPKEDEEKIVGYLRQADQIFFVLYTNRGVDTCAFLDKTNDCGLDFLNTSTKRNVYQFNHEHSDLEDYERDFIQGLILFSNQSHMKDVDDLIKKEIKKLIGATKSTNINFDAVTNEFVTFITNLAKGSDALTFYALTKRDVLNIITSILLDPYKIDFSKHLFDDSYQDELWHNIMDTKTITVTDSDSTILNFLNQTTCREVKIHCSEPKKTWNEHLSQKAQNNFTANNSNFKLLKVGSNGKLNLFDVYCCLWFDCKLPLLLKIHNLVDYHDICRIIKISNYLQVIVTKNNDVAITKTKGFVTLQDLNQVHRDAILNHPIKLQGRSESILRDLVDPSMYSYVTCRDVIRVLIKDFRLGNEYEELPEHFVARSLYKVTLNPDVLVESIETQRPEDIITENFLNMPRIISASPGMGKSILLDYIARNAPSNLWVLKIVLNHHEDYFDLNSSDYLNYFYEATSKSNSTALAKAVFEKLAKAKQILVLLDGFDEIAVRHKEQVIKIAKSLTDQGYQIWITTRPHMTAYLENRLCTVSLALKPFSLQDQTNFLNKYFRQINKAEHPLIGEFTQKLLQAAKKNLCDTDGEFTGVPLQTKLLADVFSGEFEVSLRSGTVSFEVKFDLLYLYEKFIGKKTEILCEKFGKDAKDTRVLIEEHQQLFALKTLFGKQDLALLNIDEQLNLVYANKFDKIHLLQREGVLVLDSSIEEQQFKFRFVHRTFAEYLAALWLSENCIKAREGVKLLLNRRFDDPSSSYYIDYKFLFKMFDCILTKSCVLHMMIVNKQVEQAKDLIRADPSSLNILDKGGRSVAHLTALYGVDRRDFIKSYKKRIVGDKMAEIIETIPASKIDDTLDKIMGFTALDYAFATWSLAIGDKLCEKSQNLTLSFDLGDIVKSRNIRRAFFLTLTNSGYKSLFALLFRHFVSADVLMKRACESDSIVSYCKTYSFPTQHAFYDYIEEPDATIFDLLQKNNVIKLVENKPFYNDLRFAVALGDVHNVTCLLTKHNVERQDIYCNTPVHYAAIHKRLHIFKALLAKTQEFDRAGRDGFTPLHFAAENGFHALVHELISRYVNINRQTKDGDTPLHLALKNKHLRVVKLLLPICRDLNKLNKEKHSCLHYAAIVGDIKVVADLLKKDVIINQLNDRSDTPLHLALVNKHIGIAKLLLEHNPNVYAQNQDGDTSLHFAAEAGDVDIVLDLINKHVDINHQNVYGDTPLLTAIVYNNINVAHILIAKGADVTLENVYGFSCLHNAVSAGADEFVLDLLQKGANPNKASVTKYTPLHSAAENGNVNILKILLDSCADLTAIQEEGHSCLHIAARAGKNLVIQELLNRNLNVNTQDYSGNTPLIIAIDNKQSSTAQLLLSNGAEVNIQNKNGETFLHYVAKLGSYEVLSDLTSDKLDVNLQNKFKQTPLHVSVRISVLRDFERIECQMAIISFLLSNGANANAQDEYGNTALHYVAKGFEIRDKKMWTQEHAQCLQEYHETVAMMLIDNGATVHLKNNIGETALDLAVAAGNSEVAALIQ